jgi:hypothetical protein
VALEADVQLQVGTRDPAQHDVGTLLDVFKCRAHQAGLDAAATQQLRHQVPQRPLRAQLIGLTLELESLFP